ncbi:MAG: NDP-sugar synthase [Firmicutes bacterium]|jgi:mannose-1-phosphate guanylyltransferase/phosphomannomutase|nr:NDP-sugar synthase [Bacillota bacterium]MDH7494389.1 NDP-sugar synthase [Bacillota bacterium]
MKAMVMAAGVGSRLEPLTVNVPKPMVPVVTRPAMEHILALLRRHGVREVVANLWHLPESIEAYFGNGAAFGVSLRYSREEELRGTAGGVLAAKSLLWSGAGEGTFLLVAGDALTCADLSRLVEFHREKKALVTIGLKPVRDPSRFGVVVADDDGRVLEFQEKPKRGEARSNLANTMIYVFEPEIFDHIPTEGAPDFGKDVFPRLVREGASFYGLVLDEYWCDIGTLSHYRLAHRDILAGAVHVDIPGREVSPGVWIGEGAEVHRAATLLAPVLIGRGAKVGPGVQVGPYSVIGDNCVVDEGARIYQSVVWNNTRVGREATLKDCVVGSECYLERGASLGEGVVLSDECVVEEGGVVKRNVKIGPRRTVKRKVAVW